MVYVKLEHNGYIGFGEAALPPYLPETQDSVIHFFKKAAPVLESNINLEEALTALKTLSKEDTAAKAALDIALHDLFGKIEHKAAWQLLNLEKPAPKETSVTIAIGEINLIESKLKELESFHLIKVKLGHANDREIIDTIRRFSQQPLVVDVNQGWNDKYQALEMIQWLHKQNVLYVEQPLPKNNLPDMTWLTEKSPLPLLADESFQRYADMEKILGHFNGINLKLMKSTGLGEGKDIIMEAKKRQLKVNIGCMSESSCGIAAAAQLMHYADWIDLDGPMLINNDPFTGIAFTDGKLVLPDAPGTGAILTTDLPFLS